jgi:hypothetical protein
MICWSSPGQRGELTSTIQRHPLHLEYTLELFAVLSGTLGSHEAADEGGHWQAVRRLPVPERRRHERSRTTASTVLKTVAPCDTTPKSAKDSRRMKDRQSLSLRALRRHPRLGRDHRRMAHPARADPGRHPGYGPIGLNREEKMRRRDWPAGPGGRNGRLAGSSPTRGESQTEIE